MVYGSRQVTIKEERWHLSVLKQPYLENPTIMHLCYQYQPISLHHATLKHEDRSWSCLIKMFQTFSGWPLNFYLCACVSKSPMTQAFPFSSQYFRVLIYQRMSSLRYTYFPGNVDSRSSVEFHILWLINNPNGLAACSISILLSKSTEDIIRVIFSSPICITVHNKLPHWQSRQIISESKFLLQIAQYYACMKVGGPDIFWARRVAKRGRALSFTSNFHVILH